MRKVARLSVVFLIGILALLAGGRAVCQPLQYHGGPFLETFEIYPLYYGIWAESEIDTHHAFLVNLAAYMSGKNAPAFQQPMMQQYGVDKVTVAAAKTASPLAQSAKPLTRDDLLSIIGSNQATNNLPPFGPHVLIMVFPGKGFELDCGEGCGYHASESTTAFWSAVPKNAGPTLQLVTAHEIFEASTDPAIDNFKGWDEAVDQCNNILTLSAFGGIQIPAATDNTTAGACPLTAYTDTEEKQDYEVTHDQFLNDYNRLYPQAWRLYILQSYVLANGEVRYNAVWRRESLEEKLLINATNAQFQSEYNKLHSQGWRIYILQSYVLTNGEVLYNAVWRPGNVDEQLLIGVSLAEFQAVYADTSPNGWRLYILQAYVPSNGGSLYNAVLRPGDLGETDFIDASFPAFEGEYDTLYQHGWRFYLFQSYVAANGQVSYNAIWRHGTHSEKTVFGSTYTDYLNEYDKLYPQGWRLYILNTYVRPNGELRYDAVWRQGTIDRPL